MDGPSTIMVTEEYPVPGALEARGGSGLLARLADSRHLSAASPPPARRSRRRSAHGTAGHCGRTSDFAVSCVQYGGKTTGRPSIWRPPAVWGHAPAETVVFEDALHAARTAHEAGFRVCGVWDASAEEDQAALKALADWYVRDLGDWVP